MCTHHDLCRGELVAPSVAVRVAEYGPHHPSNRRADPSRGAVSWHGQLGPLIQARHRSEDMDTESINDGDTFVVDEHEPEAARGLDQAMTHVARALNAFHRLGVPQDLALMLVERRAKLRWQCNIDKVPTFSQLLEDPMDRKTRGSSSAARASQTMASKFKGKLKRINTDPEAQAIIFSHDDAPPDAPRSYLNLMFDAFDCVVNVKRGDRAQRGEQATDNAPDVAPTDGATSTGGDTDGDVAPTGGDAAPTGDVLLGSLWSSGRYRY